MVITSLWSITSTTNQGSYASVVGAKAGAREPLEWASAIAEGGTGNSPSCTAFRPSPSPVDHLGEFYTLRHPCRAGSHRKPSTEARVSWCSNKLNGAPQPKHRHPTETLSAVHFLINILDQPRWYPFDLLIVAADPDLNGPWWSVPFKELWTRAPRLVDSVHDTIDIFHGFSNRKLIH
jgi:hypothetical protein